MQGVFYRASVRERARAQGVAGWAQNRPDGTVEACFEGPPAAVEALLDYCATGPEGAVVSRLEVHVEEPEGLSGFLIR